MSDLKFEFMGASIRQKSNNIISLKPTGKDGENRGWVIFKGKKVISILKKKPRIDIGFSKDGTKMAFSPSDTYGYKYVLSKNESFVSFRTRNNVLYEFIEKNTGDYNARFTDDGIIYIDFSADEKLRETIADEEEDDDIETPVDEKNKKSETTEVKQSDDSTAHSVVSSGSKVFVATFDCLCRQCGQPIKVIMRAGQKGKPVNPNLEYFARSEYGTKTFVTTDGITVRGIPYSRKAKGMQEGYQAHWETCAANNSGRR